jgi:hypothetical protein
MLAFHADERMFFGSSSSTVYLHAVLSWKQIRGEVCYSKTCLRNALMHFKSISTTAAIDVTSFDGGNLLS